MQIIGAGRKTLVALVVLGLTGAGSALWAGSADAQAAVKSTAAAAKDAKPAPPQTVCPILGGKIDKKVFADFKGKRVYFCCAGCIGRFEKAPAKYIKAMEDAGIVLDKTPQPAALPPAQKS